MAKRRILVVEDDPAIREVVVDALELEHYEVLAATNASEALSTGTKIPCDLVLLDLVLPGGDGFAILPELRKAWPSLPVIILTARGREEDRVRGLKLGADDYIVKPFGIRELVARVEAVLRRSAERPSDLPQAMFAGGVADFEQRELRFHDGTRVELAEREVDLLRYLARATGRLVTREELLLRVWHISHPSVRTRTIDVHIARLRDKLRDDATEPRIIETVRGRGYVFQSKAEPAS